MNDLRKRVEAEFDLTSAEPSWIEVFEVACSTLDTILQLEALVASDGLVTSGSKGQTTIHPGSRPVKWWRFHSAILAPHAI
jgi:hypothetical protein